MKYIFIVRSTFLLILINVFYLQNVFSVSFKVIADTSYPDLKFSEIYKKYGTDDSSKSLIKLFEFKQHSAKIGVLEGISIGALSGLVFNKLNNSNIQLGIVGIFIFVILAVLIYEGGFLALFNLLKWKIYNKKRLIKLLNGYFTGKNLNNRIYRKNRFKTFLNTNKHTL